jgi:hypothetical protein
MTHAIGTDLGGIRTVDDLRDRCHVDDITGCWIWKFAAPQGTPHVHYVHPTKLVRVTAKGRRAALVIAGGKDLPKGHVAWRRACCEEELCVNPAHACSGTKKQWGAWLTKTGKVKNLPSKAAASLRAWDKRGRKITPEMRQIILSDSASNEKLAQRLGVSSFAIWSLRQGRAHRLGAPSSSVWAWRP